jgi:arylsulfatase A-like enzyme
MDVPAGTVDITPTVLALLDITPADASFDGRVLSEAFTSTKAMTLPHWMAMKGERYGPYGADVHVSGVGERWYVDKAVRVPVP